MQAKIKINQNWIASKMKAPKDSVDRFKIQKVQGSQGRRKYFQQLLTESLPKFIGEDTQQQEQPYVKISRKKLTFEESAKISRSVLQSSQIKLKSRSSQKENNKIQSPMRKSNISVKSPNKSNKLNKPKEYPNPENSTYDHPYSIIKKLQSQQIYKRPEQKKIYKYKDCDLAKQQTLEQVEQAIKDLINKIPKTKYQRLSVTEQFILYHQIEAKILKVFQKNKAEEKSGNQKDRRIYNCTCVPPHYKEKSNQLLDALKLIKFVWDLFAMKLTYCPDIVKKDPDFQNARLNLRQILSELRQLEFNKKFQQMKKQEALMKHTFGKNKPSQINDALKKKVRIIMKKFNDTIAPKKLSKQQQKLYKNKKWNQIQNFKAKKHILENL